MSLTSLMWVAALLPLGGVVVSFLAELPRRAAMICLLFTAASAAVAATLLTIYLVHGDAPSESAVTFWTFAFTTAGNPSDGLAGGTIADFHPQIGVIVDALSAVLAATIATTSLLVQIHSLGYMRGTDGYRRHFWRLALLTFAAMGTVVSANLFTFMLMWGLTGLAASLVAGHWSAGPDGAAAARRMAIWQRVADLSLLMAVVVVYVKLSPAFSGAAPAGYDTNDPWDFALLNSVWHRVHTGQVAGAGTRTLVVIAVLVLITAMLRAALLPFNTWLLSTLDGPIQAAGFMQAIAVTGGGAYLVARMYPLFVETPHMLAALALVGVVAAVGGAFLALVETDVLRLVSAATVSHLGLVFVALGAGGYAAGMFHLYTHAWFGAALFLCVANLVVAYKTRVLEEIGGSWDRMRTTSWALLLAAGSSSGAVVLGGFWSTRAVLAAVLNDTTHNGVALSRGVQGVVLVGLVLTIVLGAAYPIRLLVSVARNQPSSRRGFSLARVREAERSMRISAVLLAVLAALSGLAGIPGIVHTFGHYVTVGGEGLQGAPLSVAAYVIVIVAVALGTGLGLLSGRAGASGVIRRIGEPIRAFGDLQPALDRIVAFAGLKSATQLALVDRVVDGGLVRATGDAVDLAAAAVTSRRALRWSAMATTGVIVTVVVAAALMLIVSGHAPGLRAPG